MESLGVNSDSNATTAAACTATAAGGGEMRGDRKADKMLVSADVDNNLGGLPPRRRMKHNWMVLSVVKYKGDAHGFVLMVNVRHKYNELAIDYFQQRHTCALPASVS
jgi:hypothetical protein